MRPRQLCCAAVLGLTAHGYASNAMTAPMVLQFNDSPFLEKPGVQTVSFALRELNAGRRSYFLQTTQPQRDETPSERLVREYADGPRVRSGSLAFDALFALAVEDMRFDSVSEIRDDAYNGGEAIACEVFQTGEKWHYVWTRDVSYAVNLGLGVLDPTRSANTVLFKVSPFRGGMPVPEGLPDESLQIVQDTGSGGSWPVSTDRVSWAWAAETLLQTLPEAERAAFVEKAHRALSGSIVADRSAAYDAQSGLYGGEQSFLDWRVQTYAPWITRDLAWMSASKALSTNVCHYKALSLAADLSAQFGDRTEATRYRTWASALATAIDEQFWDAEAGMYASLITPSGQREYRFDLLGNALAILSGIASKERAAEVLSRYPHGPMGAPVYFPEQPDLYVYHNRAIWPFVTAYGLAAAHRARHVAAADAAIETLIRGAALNLSNMENLEWLTGLPFFDDGPAINSRRQLWSVAGYLGMVLHSFFGYTPGAEGIVFDPFLTAGMRARLGDCEEAVLEGLSYRGALLRIHLDLPKAEDRAGYFPLMAVRLNGDLVTSPLSSKDLKDGELNEVRLSFGTLIPSNARIRELPRVNPWARRDSVVYAPECPIIQIVDEGGERFLEIRDLLNDPKDTRYQVFRDNEPLGWLEAPGRFPRNIQVGACSHEFTAVAEFRSTGHRSHSSRPLRVDGMDASFVAMADQRVEAFSSNGEPMKTPGSPYLEDWGAPGEQLIFNRIHIPTAGRYAFRLRYFNDAHTIDSGVTCGVKRVKLWSKNSREVREGVLQMPNVETTDGVRRWAESTALVVDLSAGEYNLELSDFFNMSYLATNASYRDKGGEEGPYNQFDVAGLDLIPLPPTP